MFIHEVNSWKPCSFQDSNIECHRMDLEASCPNLNCPPEKRLHIEGECCPVCEGKY